MNTEIKRIHSKTIAAIAADNDRHKARMAIIQEISDAAQHLDMVKMQQLHEQLRALD